MSTDKMIHRKPLALCLTSAEPLVNMSRVYCCYKLGNEYVETGKIKMQVLTH